MHQVAFHGLAAGCRTGCLLFICLTEIVPLRGAELPEAFAIWQAKYQQRICGFLPTGTIKMAWHCPSITASSYLHCISFVCDSDVEAQALARRSCMPSMVQETTLRAARICAPAAARSCRIAARDEDTTPVLRHAP